MVAYDIRIIGDPVLRRCADEIENIDGTLVAMVDGMAAAMYKAKGIGIAAPQVGIRKRIFVWDMGDGELRVVVNPEIVDSSGEWVFEEGCLSVPGLSWDIVRPKEVHLVGRDLNGNEVSIEADKLEARLFQHELDHLNGKLLIEHLDHATRKEAMTRLRRLGVGSAGVHSVCDIAASADSHYSDRSLTSDRYNGNDGHNGNNVKYRATSKFNWLRLP